MAKPGSSGKYRPAPPLDAAHLPYNEALIVYLREQAAAGRPLYLSTGADQRLADGVAQHLGLFDGVFSSDGATNLTGTEKLRLLESRFGRGGFAYVGNSRKDLPLLTASKAAMLANPTAGLQGLLRRKKIPVQQVFQDRASGLRSIWRALRDPSVGQERIDFLAADPGACVKDERAAAVGAGISQLQPGRFQHVYRE